MESTVTGRAACAAPSRAAHAVVAVLGGAALVYVALPVTFDGLLSRDGFAVAFLALSGALLALVAGMTEGLALRGESRMLALGCLVAFALVAIYPPGLMSGRWFASDLEPGSSAALGLALLTWVLTMVLEYLVAMTVVRYKATTDEPASN